MSVSLLTIPVRYSEYHKNSPKLMQQPYLNVLVLKRKTLVALALFPRANDLAITLALATILGIVNGPILSLTTRPVKIFRANAILDTLRALISLHAGCSFTAQHVRTSDLWV